DLLAVRGVPRGCPVCPYTTLFRSPGRGRRSAPVPSSSSPVACGGGRPSAASRDAPSCRGWWSRPWPGRSSSIPSSPTPVRSRRSTKPSISCIAVSRSAPSSTSEFRPRAAPHLPLPLQGAPMERVEHRACFGGFQDVYQHASKTLGVTMRFGAYLPPQVKDRKLPVLYWLSGLTCTEQNFITKAGAQRYAAEHGVILIAPDTSPRGEGVADADADDLGMGAGFYLNATQGPWERHYRMADYIVNELPALVEAELPASDVRGISGHSMGGHGALVLSL